MGFSVVMPQPTEHEHWCDDCRDAWAHADLRCSVSAAYPCPQHQPRGGVAVRVPGISKED